MSKNKNSYEPLTNRLNGNENEPLSPGDIIELEFKAVGGTWLKAAQVAVIEWRLKGRKDVEIISANYLEKDRVIFEVRVKKPTELTTGKKIAMLISAISPVGLVVLNYKKISAAFKKIPETIKTIEETTARVGDIVVSVGKITLVGALVVGGLYVYAKLK